MKAPKLLLGSFSFIVVTILVSFGTSSNDEVTLGTQIWTTKNLDVSTYRNGDSIPQVQDDAAWANLTTGAWCYYLNQTANGTTYGKLYNWYAVNDPRGLAPEGFHIPSVDEWKKLRTYLIDNNKTCISTSGFYALFGGWRNPDGTFYGIDGGASWWSSTEYYSPSRPDLALKNAWPCSTGAYGPAAGRLNSSDYYRKQSGLSVRCLKDY